MSVGTYYETQVAQHFARSQVDDEEAAWFLDHRDVDDDGYYWTTHDTHVEGLIEAEGKKALLEKTYVKVRVISVTKTVVEAVE